MNNTRYHTCDIIAWTKHATGEWQYNLINGTITDARTAKPIPAYLNNGYLFTTVHHMGRALNIPHHRAIYAVALGIRNIPLDYSLEVDHINHIRTDNRIANLRLIHHKENCQNPLPPRRLTEEAKTALLKRYATGRTSIEHLSIEYNCSKQTVQRLLKKAGYSRGKK